MEFSTPIKFVKREQKKDDGNPQFLWYDLVSAGPDGKLGTQDDFRHGDKVAWKYQDQMWGWRGGDEWMLSHYLLERRGERRGGSGKKPLVRAT